MTLSVLLIFHHIFHAIIFAGMARVCENFHERGPIELQSIAFCIPKHVMEPRKLLAHGVGRANGIVSALVAGNKHGFNVAVFGRCAVGVGTFRYISTAASFSQLYGNSNAVYEIIKVIGVCLQCV